MEHPYSPIPVKALLLTFAVLIGIGAVWTYFIWRREALALENETLRNERSYRMLNPIERLRFDLTQSWDTAWFESTSGSFTYEWVPLRPKPTTLSMYQVEHEHRLDSIVSLVFSSDPLVRFVTLRTDSLRLVPSGSSQRVVVCESTVRREEQSLR